ncbi:PAAR domain-containing protein [Aulosira sp. FACHB-615]|uniref:PAAR domain-containing protein n=1 Tax=Aulosira sp. FACHB-615 TaxID=2692777 RepID=UPI00168A3C39|nr:PAAR domain-containing protein [Aulosira sp. FACHB-615]MBD2488012.1 PAAR domain-containing protein [Aulosira sp. FACHB-615]
MFPAARLTDLTVTGDPITAPGVPNVLIVGLPAACVGDLVAGPVVTGSIVLGSFTVLIGGRPAARVTSQVAGVNTVTGVPLTTVVGIGAPTVLIGG